jgi:spore maturation protein CgeB
MKIFLLADYYQNYLNAFYASHETEGISYDQHQNLLFADYFGSFVSYYNHFKKRGHDVKLVIGNDAILQNKWLAEHKINGSGLSKCNVVLRQMEEFVPDVFFIGSMFDYYGKFLEKVAQITKNIFAWISCPYSERLDFSGIRCLLTSNDLFVERFKAMDMNAELLRVAFDTEIISALDNKKTIDVSFIGGLSRKTHRSRVQGLELLLAKGIDVKTFGYGLKRPLVPFAKHLLWNSYGGELWGIEMYRTLNRSKISLNFHIDVAQGMSGNMRIFEATGCGTLLMTESAKNLNRLFQPGKEVVAYDNFADLNEKIRYYLSHDTERGRIADEGQKACIERHSYSIRILEFESILLKYCT